MGYTQTYAPLPTTIRLPPPPPQLPFPGLALALGQLLALVQDVLLAVVVRRDLHQPAWLDLAARTHELLAGQNQLVVHHPAGEGLGGGRGEAGWGV